MSPAVAPPPWYAGFKLAVFALLVVNTVSFASHGTLSEGLDSIAWFTLLALFELETAHPARIASRRAVAAVHVLRLAAAAAVIAAAVGYLLENAWLDALNAWLWVAVVVLLEIEVRCTQAVARHRGAFGTAAAVLYLGLASAVTVWAWRGEWLNAYDAALWLTAFAAIEMNLLARFTERASPERPASA